MNDFAINPALGLAQPWAELAGIAPFDETTRLYSLQGEGDLAQLMVEAWSLREGLNTPWEMDLACVSVDARLDINRWPAQALTLRCRLSDGSLSERTGLITRARRLGGDGGLCRYRLTLRPWLALLEHTVRSQAWQERTTVEIIEGILARHASHAAWRWADDVADHLAQSPFNGSSAAQGRAVRSYTVQYRQSDLHFISQLLTQEGLGYRFEQDAAAPMGHRLVFFADSANAASCPEDPSSASALGGAGIRFHRAGSVEVQDAVQALGRSLSSIVDTTVVSSWDYKAGRIVTGSATSDWLKLAGKPKRSPLGLTEDYADAGAYAFCTQHQADRAALLLQQANECSWEQWIGRSSVRSFASGSHFSLTQSTLDQVPGQAQHLQDTLQAELPQRSFVLTEVIHAGINNLPRATSERLTAIRQQTARDPQLADDPLAPWIGPELRQQAAATGYANAFTALRRHRPWRNRMLDARGERIAPRQRIEGMLSATVVGATGQSVPQGADEIHTDALGRVRIAFDFQRTLSGMPEHSAANATGQSTWVRVSQWLTGPGMGAQFIPRIGQEVLVSFEAGHPDRPLVVGTMYNGRGEGGIAPTPGGRSGPSAGSSQPDATAVFGQSSDHRSSGQGNLIGTDSGGHSPAWHGASPADHAQGGQRNAAALSGIKTKEFGGQGYSQLVMDDSDGQLRVQLATTQYSTQLNMGHLIHQADNHRGGFRGEGFELRTDAYGVIRARMGLGVTSYQLATNGQHPGSAEPAGDNLAGMALARRLFLLGKALNDAATQHQTVRLASHIGSFQAHASALNDTQAPNQALHTALSGMVNSTSLAHAEQDAASHSTQPGPGQVPHSTAPILSITARAGLAMVAGQDIQVAAGEGITLGSGQSTEITSGGAARMHTGQAIGILGGAIEPGTQAAGTGLSMMAAQGPIKLQAQSDKLQIAAKGMVDIQSKSGHIDWAAAKRIVIATQGGASITMEGGNIVVECPGTLTVKAGMKSFDGPARTSFPLPTMPKSICVSCLLAARASASAFAQE